jgi:hypothetical protein
LSNEALVTFYYKFAAFFLVGVIVAHVLFAAWFLVYFPAEDMPGVLQYIAFNVTILVVEVFLSRMAFMLGSRSGQLRDLRCAVLLASQITDPSKLEPVTRAIMSLRREAGSTKVVDVESVAAACSKK